MATFEDRLKLAIGPRGYEACMRRSVQTAILFEAHRALAAKLPALRPFQRKIAFWTQSNSILESLELLQLEHKSQIMWRTATSKEPMPAETAWKRLKLIERELQKILTAVKPLLVPGRSHDEVCEMFVQQQFEALTGNQDKPHPATFEFTHNNVIFCYRLFYRGLELDPSFPEPVVRHIEIPVVKPVVNSVPLPTELIPFITVGQSTNANADHSVAAVASVAAPGAAPVATTASVDDDEDREAYVSGVAGGGDEPHEERRSLLKEVREHLDLLREFEGVISQEDINKRKRELFLALPPAPPPAKKKKET